jgi:hypothetical protein
MLESVTGGPRFVQQCQHRANRGLGVLERVTYGPWARSAGGRLGA